MTIVYRLVSSWIKLLDLRGGDRIERGARLVHQDHLGLDGDRARDAEALLLAARQRRARCRRGGP